jgi:cholest-4-en-3-one 26-monooxygenase
MTVDLTDPGTYQRGIPHALFRDLRAHDPVSWQTEPGGRGFWAVTRHADVVAVLKNPHVYSSWRGSVLLADPPAEFLERLRESMMNRDPPDHSRLRRMVNKALNPRRIDRLEAEVAAHAAEVIERVRERGACDFAADVAEELPLHMICGILGVPEADRRALYRLTVRMFATEIADPAEAMRDKVAAAAAMRAYGAELRRVKQVSPADDLASELVTAEVDGSRLTEREFEAFFMLLFNAGTDTTRSLLCYGLDALLDRPALIERLRAEPSSLAPAIEEMLRFEPPVIQIRRTATRRAELGGRTIAEGDKVVLFFPSANRDEAVFTEPDRFDIDRSPNDHVAFGSGTHFCLGAPLARLEARHLFSALLGAVRDLERDGPAVPMRTNFVRGMKRLPIRYLDDPMRMRHSPIE